MTDRAPIPAEDFDGALDRLDRAELAAFVGRLEAATGAGDVDVDSPLVTIGEGDHRERILVAPEGADADAVDVENTSPEPDAIVVGPDGSPTIDAGASVRTTADLRQQLLYAVPPETAESIAEEWLGEPARSTSYAPEPTPTAASSEDATPGPNAGTSDETSPSESDGPTDGAPAGGSSIPRSGVGPGAPSGPDGATTQGRRDSSGPADDPSGSAARNGAGIVVVGVLVAIILAVTGGVVYAAEVSTDGDAGAFAAPAAVDDGGISHAEIRRRSRGPIDENGAVITATATPQTGGANGSDGGPLVDDTEANRNVRPAPNCRRSFLLVVQIQMNALKYNNNTTDDGIRTVRRFASPRNRQTIQTFDEFAGIIKSSTYSPMLSYDSVQYTPIQSSDDYAQVQVITREDDNVTGRYYFRLGKVDHGEYEGCWMTDAVVSVPETNNFSGKVAGQSTGSSNGTA